MGGSSLLPVLGLALLPSLGNLLGVALAEWRKPPEWLVGGALHAAAGIATAVAAIELIPRSQERIETWLLVAALFVGAICSAGIAKATRAIRDRIGSATGRATTWGAYAAIGVDLFTDGLMTGGGGAVARELGLLLALSQVAGNLPGGFAIAADFCSAKIPRGKRLRALAIYPLLPVIGALVGYVVLAGAGPLLTGFVLALFAGLLLIATIEDIVPEADQPKAKRRISSPSFALGFGALLLTSAYLGE
ncbi:ZIP family metal transporter [Qipengyuania sp. MTN3-11]|uniref:ZIP family metal transporter n=1 Tax=Qipengyuania sp. MTN3-11 TaxID=3056557 RepID=UPI0036F41910